MSKQFKAGNTVRFTDVDHAGNVGSKKHKLYEVLHNSWDDGLVHLSGGLYVLPERLALVSETTLPFTTGDKVVLKHVDRYTTYDLAATSMGLTNWQRFNNKPANGTIATVLSAFKHEYEFQGVIVAIELENGHQHIINASNLEKYVEPVPVPMAYGEFREGQVVKCIRQAQDGHGHWKFELGEHYPVVNDGNHTAPKHPEQCCPSRLWGDMRFALVSEAPVVVEPEYPTFCEGQRVRVKPVADGERAEAVINGRPCANSVVDSMVLQVGKVFTIQYVSTSGGYYLSGTGYHWMPQWLEAYEPTPLEEAQEEIKRLQAVVDDATQQVVVLNDKLSQIRALI